MLVGIGIPNLMRLRRNGDRPEWPVMDAVRAAVDVLRMVAMETGWNGR